MLKLNTRGLSFQSEVYTMASRLNLHNSLIEALGTKSVYFQPPESVKLVYPCIIYEESKGRAIPA